MKSIGDVLSPNDPELVEKTLARIDQQDQWNDLFSTKLIELLDGLDGFKADARKRMLQIEEISETSKKSSIEAASSMREAKVHFHKSEQVLRTATQEFEQARKEALKAQTLQESAARTFTDALRLSARTSRIAILAMAFSSLLLALSITSAKVYAPIWIALTASVLILVAAGTLLWRIK